MIFLIGMPGVGKTWWAENASKILKTPYNDIDREIEILTNKSIQQIFQIEGEPAFRTIERNVLQTIIENAPKESIVACGGGTPCYMNNMELMQKAGRVMYLRGDMQYIMSNINNHRIALRPKLAANEKTEAILKKLYEQRKPIYEKADITINVEGLTLATFVQIIQNA